ncbi:threonine-phosphate decarboxylase [Marinobacterium nitratireducens]|uniref:threonine-phosphate decarboxylase n=1 Tax=Marinobacterium nitratireducens TaxID=518897 RepID=A0A917ZFZ8_9GAMM|nr:threonine-phosphate decarboxylase CobD [Marinobacterium nitratireducens]GGO81439.1 threonine-phosphate decarboxylase [Marinobacterium nitratireducens]
MLEHGGRLRQAVARYGGVAADWLDLSTGLNPHGYPVAALPPASWARLPEPDDGLEDVARDYYGCDALLPVAGSQSAIQMLPWLRSRSRVSVMEPGYREHFESWRRAGHEVEGVSVAELRRRLPDSDVLVLIHPGNPDGSRFGRDELLDWHGVLAGRGGWLVVDEAFIDTEPGLSLAAATGRPGLIVLRSVGKFFGLAGIRVGFVLSDLSLLEALKERLGPWAVSGPGREAARMALADLDWQRQTRERLVVEGGRLRRLLTENGLAPAGGCSLFQWVRHADAAAIHEQLAVRAILTRLFDRPASLRFGLPPDETGWCRLQNALRNIAG